MSDENLVGQQGGPTLLVRLRQRAGLTQSQLAERADISRSMIAQLEMGDRRPSRRLLLRLAEAMELDSDDLDRLNLMYGFTPEGDTPEQIAAFLRADKRLSESQAERLADLMRDAYTRALTEDGVGERGGRSMDDRSSSAAI